MKSRANKIIQVLTKIYNNPVPELRYSNLYQLLLSVMLSAQSTDKQVNKITTDLFKIISKPEDTIDLGLNKLRISIKSIGLYNSKSANIYKTSLILKDKFRSNIPDNMYELMSLPGVGKKTASVILNIGFKIPRIAVDTHIFRIANRTGMALANTPSKVQDILESSIDTELLYNAHLVLINHGRSICKARKPLCSLCAINHICLSYTSK